MIGRRAGVGLAVVAVAVFGGAGLRSVSAQSAEPEWLQWLNYHRAVGGLAPVVHNPDFDASVLEHARYLVDLDQEGLCPEYPHCEAIPPGTPLGDEGSKNIIQRASGPTTEREVVEGLMAAPFHAMAMLRPGLTEVGFALYHNDDASPVQSAGLVNTSADPSPTDDSRIVTWPADGGVSTLVAYSGNETPDPLVATSCSDLEFGTSPGGGDIAGLPIIVSFATVDPVEAVITEVQSGEVVPSCVAQPDDYPVGSTASLILGGSEAFLIIPEQPLAVAADFRVVVSGAVDIEFEFSTVPAPDDPPPLDSAIRTGPRPQTTVPSTVPRQPGASTPDTTTPLPTPPTTPTAGKSSSGGLPGWASAGLRWAPFVAGVALMLAASAAAGRRRWAEETVSAVAVLGTGVALVTPMFLVWGVTRIGSRETLYRGIDLLGVAVMSGTLVLLTIGSALVALVSGTRVPTLARVSLGAIGIGSVAMIALSETIAGFAFAASSHDRFGAEAAVGPGPWFALVLAGFGLVWCIVPSYGAARVIMAPFRRFEVTGVGAAIAALAVVGAGLVVVARYIPWASAGAGGFELDVPGRSVPFVGSSALLGLFTVVAGVALIGLGRTTLGLVVGGTGAGLISFPAAVAVVVGDRLVNGDVSRRLVEYAESRFSTIDPDVVVSPGPWMTLIGGLVLGLAVASFGWTGEAYDD